MKHGTPRLTSPPKDGEVSCEARLPRSHIRSLTSLDRAELKSPDEYCISRSATHPTRSARVSKDNVIYTSFRHLTDFLRRVGVDIEDRKGDRALMDYW